MADDVNIYFLGCFSLLIPEFVVYHACMGVKGHSRTRVPRLNIYRSIISLSEIAHQMWNDHLFSQRNKTSKIVVEVKA